MKTKTIVFLKSPTGRFLLSYNVGDVAEFEEKQADLLIETGYAKNYVNPDAGDDSDIPADLPGRQVLVKLGVTLAELKQIDDLTELKGIGKPMAEKIKIYLADHPG